MSALIFTAKGDSDIKTKIGKQFDNYELIEIEVSEHTLYFEANQVVRHVQSHEGPVFLIVDKSQPLFSAIVAAKLSRYVPSFQVMEWNGKRFRVLRAP